MFSALARLFRIVNLPTLPGDVFAGAAAVIVGAKEWFAMSTPPSLAAVFAAAGASVFIYMFGLVDNDIVGAKTDVGRPITNGEISMRTAHILRGACILCVAVIAGVMQLPMLWAWCVLILVVCIVIYNRTKWPLMMGLCRGVNVGCGGVAVGAEIFSRVAEPDNGRLWLQVLIAVWTIYITIVTKYSEGEEDDPAKRRRVGMLIGGIVYLQLIALLAFYVQPLLIAGAAMLILLRLVKRLLPGVSAS